jgi:hypothetical protein
LKRVVRVLGRNRIQRLAVSRVVAFDGTKIHRTRNIALVSMAVDLD